MLWFEREVVARLTISDDQRTRDAVADFVDGALHDMPEHLRAGIAVASIGLGSVARVVRPAPASALAPGAVDPVVRTLDRSPIGPIRQYVRLFRSLVLFAEQEL
jgi:hypothetical protein